MKMSKVARPNLTKKDWLRMSLSSIAAAVLYAIAIRCFIQAPGSHLLAGGVSGVALIIAKVIHQAGGNQALWYSIFYFVLNLPLAIIAYKKIGRFYALFSIITVALTSILISIIPQDFFSFVGLNSQNDLLLIALAGGVLGGTSTGISLNSGASGGGVDIIITLIGIKKGRKVGIYSFIINACILIVGGIIFQEWTAMLYTIVFMYVSSVMINVLYIRNNKMMISIITNKKEEMSNMLFSTSHHGVTIYECEGAYTGNKRYELRTIVLENEVRNLVKLIEQVDEQAFTMVSPIRFIKGRFRVPSYK
ncbi:YitT family protein [bacterium]|jgi:uncharacterized membrane-anchored protein YitT (DUF2179 family)|nr:YitT family protein [bacterium]